MTPNTAHARLTKAQLLGQLIALNSEDRTSDCGDVGISRILVGARGMRR